MSLDDFTRVDLLFGPSPIHRLERLSEHLGGQVHLWAKREDCNSGLAYGGNKVRKLEYLAADALARGCDTLVSIGGVQSNHTRQVAAVAARLGLGCVLVQEHWVQWPDAVYDKVGNILLSRIMGADVRLNPAGFDIGIRPSWEAALESVREQGGTPYAIPAGASDHPLGGLGFARWAPLCETTVPMARTRGTVCSVPGPPRPGSPSRSRFIARAPGDAQPVAVPPINWDDLERAFSTPSAASRAGRGLRRHGDLPATRTDKSHPNRPVV